MKFRNVIKNKRSVLKAFTLLEMLIVLTIIGILMAIGMATYSRIQDSAMKQALEVEFRNLNLAIYNYQIENGAFPTSVEDLLVGGYINRDLSTDPWNTQYMLRQNQQTGRLEIVSAGPDRKFDTEDDIVHEAGI
jgi:general secretion pathway protein G